MVSTPDLQAAIHPAGRFHVGDKATFEVRIRNRSRNTAYLVASVDGVSPKVTIEIAGPGWTARPTGGNTTGVTFDDVFEIAAGESFDPYRRTANPNLGTFTKPGRYKATFRYDTTNTDPRSWTCGDCVVAESFREMLEEIPAVSLTATTTFEVAQ